MEKSIQERTDEITNQALASLGLDFTEEGKKSKSSLMGGKVNTKFDPKELEEPKEETTDALQEEEKNEEVTEEVKETEEVQEETPEPKEEEDVIPKSKYEKVKERLEQRINSLTAQLKQQEQAKPTLTSTREKLEQLSEKELIALEDEIEDSVFEARQNADTAKLAQLRELRREIRDVATTAPKRFIDKQVRAYEETANNIIGDPLNEDIDFNKESQAIKQIAAQIFSNKPDLHSLVRGQALALELAIEYYRETKKLNQGKGKEASLKRELVKQKQKTTLGTSKSTGTPRESIDMRKAFEQAKKSGSDHDKANFLGKLLDVESYLK